MFGTQDNGGEEEPITEQGAVDPAGLHESMLESLLAVHSAPTKEWLADASATAAERSLGALYGLFYVLEASGELVGVRPASSERVRRMLKVRELLQQDLTTLRFDPDSRPQLAAAIESGQPASLADLGLALPLALDNEALAKAQRSLGVGEVWAAPLHSGGTSDGLLLLFMPPSPHTSLQQADLLARHVAVAYARLKEMEAGRKRGEIDAVRWVYDEHRFHEQLTKEIRRAERHKRPLSVILVRLRNLGDLKARYGRFLADQLLRQTGRRLAQTMRDTDFLGAFHEDGFAGILVEADAGGAQRARERVLSGLHELQLPHADLPDLDIDLICATASYPEGGETSDDLMRAAEERLLQEPSRDLPEEDVA